MADVKISALPAATTPLDGTELAPIVQSGTTKRVTVANLTVGRALTASSLTLTTPLSASNGGTGQSSYATGDLLYASGTTALSKLADVATGNALISGGVGTAPSWGKIGLTTHVSGTLPVANGGTGITSFGTGVATALGNNTNGASGICVQDASGILTVNRTGNGNAGVFTNGSTSAAIFTGGSSITFGDSAGNNQALIVPGSNYYTIYTNGAESARITSAGDLLVGTTSGSGRLVVKQSDAGNPGARIYLSSGTFGDNGVMVTADRNTTNNSFYFISAYNNTAAAYKFRVADSGDVTNTNGAYGQISDISLKENIVDATPKLNDLLSVKVKNFNFIGDSTKQIGVVAQELEEVFPALVETSAQDGVKSVKYSVFTPIIIKALQELAAKVSALEAKQ